MSILDEALNESKLWVSFCSRLNYIWCQCFEMTFYYRHFVGRSPIFSHVNATLQGSATVHAFNAGEILEKEFHEFQDHNTSSFYLFTCASRWFALSVDGVSLIFSIFVTYSFLILGDCKWIHLFKLWQFQPKKLIHLFKWIRCSDQFTEWKSRFGDSE